MKNIELFKEQCKLAEELADGYADCRVVIVTCPDCGSVNLQRNVDPLEAEECFECGFLGWPGEFPDLFCVTGNEEYMDSDGNGTELDEGQIKNFAKWMLGDPDADILVSDQIYASPSGRFGYTKMASGIDELIDLFKKEYPVEDYPVLYPCDGFSGMGGIDAEVRQWHALFRGLSASHLSKKDRGSS